MSEDARSTVSETADGTETPANRRVRDSRATTIKAPGDPATAGMERGSVGRVITPPGPAGAPALELVRPGCAALNRRGEPCRSRAVGSDGYCVIHSPARLSAAELGRRGGLQSGRARRELAKTVRQRLAERLEADAGEVWRVFREAFDAMDGDEPDHRARLAAAEGALSQAFGRPAQEIIGDPDQPVAIILGSLLARAREELGE